MMSIKPDSISFVNLRHYFIYYVRPSNKYSIEKKSINTKLTDFLSRLLSEIRILRPSERNI